MCLILGLSAGECDPLPLRQNKTKIVPGLDHIWLREEEKRKKEFPQKISYRFLFFPKNGQLVTQAPQKVRKAPKTRASGTKSCAPGTEKFWRQNLNTWFFLLVKPYMI